MPTLAWLNMARRICSCWRNLVSRRLRTATSALRARLGTDTLTMSMISGRNDSFSLVPGKGGTPASAPQTAKPERMSAAVAVSRWPHRSAAHNNGRIARSPKALVFMPRSSSGLKATRPTTPAATETPAEAAILPRLKLRKSPIPHSTTTGAKTSAPAASRSHHMAHTAMASAQSTCPARHKLPTPAAAPTIVLGTRLTRANFATPVGVSNVLRPCDQTLIR